VTLDRPKWSLQTTHCTRRSFCTINYISGTDVFTIMAISGHKTEKSFRRYLKLVPTNARLCTIPNPILIEVGITKPSQQVDEIPDTHNVVAVIVKWGANNLLPGYHDRQ
jgi:hypothetical protein